MRTLQNGVTIMDMEMTDNPYVYKGSIHMLDSFLKKSDWQCDLSFGLIITPDEDKIPNRFHRKMQELILGWKWKKVKK